MIKKYRKINKLLGSNNGTKYGLSKNDLKRGLTTIEQKLEKECPGFRRLEALFGKRQNVNPTSVMTTSTNFNEDDEDEVDDDDSTVSSDDDDEEDDDVPAPTAPVATPTGGDKAQDILAMIRARQKQ